MYVDYVWGVLKVLAVVVFLNFFFNGLTIKLSIKKQRIAGMIYNIVFTILFVVALILDKYVFDFSDFIIIDTFLYIVFIVAFICGFAFYLVQFIRIKDFVSIKKIKPVYTVRKKEEYVYVVYKHNDSVYLINDINTGVVFKLKQYQFADDIVNDVNKSLKDTEICCSNRCGIITTHEEKYDSIYYCYLIELRDEYNNPKFSKYSLQDLITANINDFDRFVIYNCIMKNDFDETF